MRISMTNKTRFTNIDTVDEEQGGNSKHLGIGRSVSIAKPVLFMKHLFKEVVQ